MFPDTNSTVAAYSRSCQMINMERKKLIILLTLVLCTFMAALDSSIVNVSLPTMRRQFRGQLDDVEWIITAYMLSYCVFMPLTNWLKDTIGLQRLLIWALVLFTLGSLLCSLSVSLPMLIGSRVVQALGGGAIGPSAMSILTITFPGDERGRVMGWWGLGGVLGPAIGPTLGGILTEQFGWPSIFYINVPIGCIAIFLCIRYLKFLKKPSDRQRPDTVGFIWFTLFIVLLQYSLSQLSNRSMTEPQFWIPAITAIVSLCAFVAHVQKKAYPLLDLSLFSNTAFTNCILVTLVRAVALFGGSFLMPFLLQGLLGFSEIQSGLLMLPNSALMAILMPFAGGYSDKYGARYISVAGLFIVSLSMLMYSRLSTGDGVLIIVLTMVCRGIGMGLLISPLNAATIGSVPHQKVTMASSIFNLTMQLGGSIGVALLTIVHQHMYRHYVSIGNEVLVAEHLALRDGFWAAAMLLILALIPAMKIPLKAVSDKKEAEMLVHAA